MFLGKLIQDDHSTFQFHDRDNQRDKLSNFAKTEGTEPVRLCRRE
jgi:hypothetical protein